jgi:DNA-directed RNA polymerase subunit RPC12/RpoP
MTIDLRTLKCGECGSGTLRRAGLNQYQCEHCGSVSLVEDHVSDRLEHVLEQVKGEAARRLAQEEAAHRRSTNKAAAIIFCVAVAMMLVVVPLVNGFTQRGKASSARRAAAAPPAREIPVDSLQLVEARQVLLGSGDGARPKLLVTVRNQSDRPLERAGVTARFFDGDEPVGEGSQSVPIGLLQPGESAPLLLDLPAGRKVTRQVLSVPWMRTPGDAVDGPPLSLARALLLQQGDAVRLVGRLVNARSDAGLAGMQVLATLHDEAGNVIGLGHGYPRSGVLAPGESTSVDLRMERLGDRRVPIASWDYRIDYQLAPTGRAGRMPVRSHSDRVVRVAGGPQSFHPELRLSAEDLLADEAERFDPAQLELAPLVAVRSTTQEPLYLTEIVNRSADAIVLSPGAVIARFDGARLDGSTTVGGLSALYPGERLPVLLEPRDAPAITQTRFEWKPMRRAALPGPRAPLVVEVTSTRADTSSVLVNFSRRYSYKFVQVSGQVRNAGADIVRKPVLWLSLRDRDGRLTGFGKVDNLPSIAAGDSVPFQLRIDQLGRDFARVDTLYQTD